MIVTGAIFTFFLGICIFLFYRAEGLQSKLNAVQKEVKTTNKANQNLIDIMAIVALKNEEFAVKRLVALKDEEPETAQDITTITPFITHYSMIIREVMKGNGQLSVVVNKLYEGAEKGSFKRFTNYISRQDASIKRLWSTNNIASYISLVEALLIHLEEQSETKEIENKKAS